MVDHLADDHQVVLMQKYGPARLDDLMDLPQPERTRALRAWVAYEDEAEQPSVKLKPVKKKPMVVTYRDKTYRVDQNGRRFPRRLASYLLSKYGKDNPLLGHDRRTGWSYTSYTAYFNHPDREKLKPLYFPTGTEPIFEDNYLTHIPDEPVPAGTHIFADPAAVTDGGEAT